MQAVVGLTTDLCRSIGADAHTLVELEGAVDRVLPPLAIPVAPAITIPAVVVIVAPARRIPVPFEVAATVPIRLDPVRIRERRTRPVAVMPEPAPVSWIPIAFDPLIVYARESRFLWYQPIRRTPERWSNGFATRSVRSGEPIDRRPNNPNLRNEGLRLLPPTLIEHVQHGADRFIFLGAQFRLKSRRRIPVSERLIEPFFLLPLFFCCLVGECHGPHRVR
jgi:hypothetical protein